MRGADDDSSGTPVRNERSRLGRGVAANRLLRDEMRKRSPVQVIVPRPELCTDNGAMIGAAAYFTLRHGMAAQWDLDVVPDLRLG